MDLGLRGRVALVTGANGGIGAAIARTFGAEGCRVAVGFVVDEAAAERVASEVTAAGGEGWTIEQDVRSFRGAEEALARVVDRFGGLDILVNNAGITRDRVVWKMSEEDWDEVLAVNLKGAFNCSRAAAPILRQRGWGKIVNLASVNGLRGKFGQVNYSASKGGLIAMSKTLARELGRFNVNVNAVAPGLVETEMTRAMPKDAYQESLDEIVLGRAAVPQDVADLVCFLCSERARHITGEVIRIDGGAAM